MRPKERTIAIYFVLCLSAGLLAAQVPETYTKIWNDAVLQERMRLNIEQHRKGDAVIQVVDSAGKPIPDATLVIQQQSHEFLFGCNLFVLGQLATSELNARYEAGFTNLFNFATVPFYWGDLEPEQGKPRFAEGSPYVWRRPPPDRLVKWCLANGITPKGHALMYVKNMFMPAWTARKDAEALRVQSAKHMAEIAGRYGRDIPIWDVVNEEIPRRRYTNEWPVVSAHFLPWSFREAGRLLPKEAQLLLNDGTHEAHDTPGDYETLIKGLQQEGAPVEGIGIQFHVYNRAGMLNGKSLPPAQIAAVYERFGKLGLPLYISEITVPGNGENGAELQAAIVANLYRLWFSTPQMAGVTWWNLGDGAAFQEENKALGGLLDKEMKPKPAYEALDRLINKEWKTALTLRTDAAGEAKFRGFHGKYSIRVATGTSSEDCSFQLGSGGGLRRARLTVP